MQRKISWKVGYKLTVIFHLIVALNFWGGSVMAQTGSRLDTLGRVKLQFKGVVLDASSKKPISGVQVHVADFSSVFTDENGRFSLSIPHADATLITSYEGYERKEVMVNGQYEGEIYLNKGGQGSMFEEVLMPYGKLSKARINQSIQSLTMGKAWKGVKEFSDTYMQGNLSGINVIRHSGTPGAGASFFVRGFSSLYGTNMPLIVIDGMLFDNQVYGQSIIAGNMFSPLSHIDVKDIDEITLMKDGTSYFGAKGANGVLLINTAKATVETTKIDFAAYGGISTQPSAIPLLNASEYRNYLSDILQSQGVPSQEVGNLPYMRPAGTGYYMYHQETDWQKETFQEGTNQNYYLKVEGGDNIALYGLSVGYSNMDGVIRNTNRKQYFTRFNGDLQLGKKLSANVSLSFSSIQQNLRDQGYVPHTSPIYLSQVKAPFLSVNEMTDDGLQSPNLADVDIFNTSNPRAITDNAIGTNKNYRFMGSTTFRFAFNESLNLQSLIGVTYDKIREGMFIPEKGVVHDTIAQAVVSNRSGSNVGRLFSLFNDTRLSYAKSFDQKHFLAGRLGLRYSHSESENDFGFGFNSATDDLVTVGMGVGQLRQLGGDLGSWRWMSTYANVEYDFLHKYLLSFNMAADGSSRFGHQVNAGVRLNDNAYALFPSLSAGWLVSSERFLAQQHVVDLLKLRASYGLVGNDDIGNYNARQYYVPQNLLGMQGLVRGNVGNPYLKWETVAKINLGLDMALFNERVQLTADVYRNRTSDMLNWQEIPAQTGKEFMLINSGEMETKGFDITLGLRILDKALKWNAGLNFSIYRNKITAIPDDKLITDFGSASYISAVGSPVNLFYGYRTQGVFATSDEANAAALYSRTANGGLLPFAAGDVRFANVADGEQDIALGQSVIDENDRQVIGDPNPDFVGGFSNTLAWKGFSLDLLFTFSYGNDVYNASRAILESQSSFDNQSIGVLGRWRAEGQVTDVPRATWQDPVGNSRFSDRWIEDGSYLKLRHVSLNYDLKTRATYFKSLSVFLSASNVFTWTKYKGYDPEVSAGNGPFGQGIDYWREPLVRTTQLGLRFGL